MKSQTLDSLILLIFPIALLAVTFYKAEFSRLCIGQESEPTRDGRDFLTQSRMIRASACIFIILHHLVQTVTSYGYVYKGPITLLNYMGYLFTALFFFFSGFGLIVSFYSKPDYLDHFFSRRILSVLIPFWVANLAGIVIEVVKGLGTPSSYLKELVGLTLINGNGWFIIEIVLLYCAFYLFFRFLKNKDLALILMLLTVLFIIVASFLRGHDLDSGDSRWFRGEWWYNSTCAFGFGMLYGRFRDSWNSFFEKSYKIVTALCGVAFLLVFSQSIYTNNHRGYYHELSFHGRRDALLTLMVQTITCLLFTLVVLLINRRLTIGNKPLKFVSSMSLEIFLIHGFFVSMIFGGKNYPDPIFFLAVLISSFILAYLLSLADSYLLDKAKELLTKLQNNEKRKKVLVTVLLMAVLFLAVIALFSGRRFILAKSEYEDELVTLRNADVGDEVRFGHFDTDTLLPGAERLTWIVIDRKGNSLRLLSKYGIAGSFYNQKHEEISWRDSDLYALLNSEDSTQAFSRYEARILSEDPGTKETISLLTVDDAKELFATDKDRELEITSAALANGTNENQKSKYNQWDMKGYRTSWWWLKGSDTPSVYAPIVTEDGEILEDKKVVNKPSGAIRPVIWVTLPSDN